jgi:hypothetical protein
MRRAAEQIENADFREVDGTTGEQGRGGDHNGPCRIR